ncbi:hypothetical protein [Thermococcus sp.]
MEVKGGYITFEPNLKSQIGYYFNVSTALIDRYFGPNTTVLALGAMALADGKSLLLMPKIMFTNCSGEYYLVKPMSSDLLGEKFNYSAVKSYQNWSEMPYYGVLWYPHGFIPLLKYDPTKPGEVTLAPNVKPFGVPLCSGTSTGPGETLTSSNPSTSVRVEGSTLTLPLGVLLFLGIAFGVLGGVVLGRKLR